MNKSEHITPVILISILCIFIFGLFIPLVTLFSDSWLEQWVQYSRGSEGLMEYSGNFRVLSSYISELTDSFLGIGPVNHHIALITIWFLNCVVVWRLLHFIWPENNFLTNCIALMYTVCPAYLTFPSQNYLYVSSFLLYNASICMTLGGIRKSNGSMSLTTVSIITQLLALVVLEYTISLEFTRIILIAYIISSGDSIVEKMKNIRVNKLLKRWFPNAIVCVIFFLYRFFLLRGQPDAYNERLFLSKLLLDPSEFILTRLELLFTDFYELIFIAWFRWGFLHQIFDTVKSFSLTSFGYIIVIFSTFILVFVFLNNLNTKNNVKKRYSVGSLIPSYDITILGIFLFITSGATIWFAARHFRFDGPLGDNDRYALATMLGSTFVSFSIIRKVFRKKYLPLIFSFLISLAVGYHLYMNNQFRHRTNDQKDLFYQLSWRIPGIKPLSTIVFLEYQYGPDYELSAAVNFLYSTNYINQNLEYWTIQLPQDEDDAIDLIKKESIYRKIRSFEFNGSRENSLYILKGNNNYCTKVLTKQNKDYFLNIGRIPQYVYNTIEKNDVILDYTRQSKEMLKIFFGDLATEYWCYYYQIADHAFHNGQYEKVLQVYLDTVNKEISPVDMAEYRIFLEAARIEGEKEVFRQIYNIMISDLKVRNYLESSSEYSEINRALNS